MKKVAILLMAGTSSRMNTEIPKQFIKINNKPIFIYTLEKFLAFKEIDEIILVVNQDKIEEVKLMLEQFKMNNSNITIVSGSSTRTKSLKQAYDYLIQAKDNDIFFITHDVARPLVLSSIIKEHLINSSLNNNVLITAIKCNDTLSYVDNKDIKIIDRSKVYKHQTPQSVHIKHLIEVFNQPCTIWENKTDLWDLLENQSINLKIINGDESNFKITTQFDLDLFQYLLNKKI